MERTITIELRNERALTLIRELEALQLIRIIPENVSRKKEKLSDKYRGVFTSEDAKSFNDHTQTMRNEWNNT